MPLSRASLCLAVLLLFCLHIPANSKSVSATLPYFDFLGPFLIGKTEVDGDPVSSAVHNCTLSGILSRRAGCPKHFFSEIVPGGMVGWTRVTTSNNVLHLGFPQHAQEVRGLNKATALEMSGYAVSDFNITRAGMYLFSLTAVHTFWLDGVMYMGDIYSHQTPVPITLSKGTHSLWLRIRGRQQVQVACSIVRTGPRSKELLSLNAVGQLTDLVEGQLPLSGISYLPLRIQNIGKDWMKQLEFEIIQPTATGKGTPPRVEIVDTHAEALTIHVDDRIAPYFQNLAPNHAVLVPVAFRLQPQAPEKENTPKESWWGALVDSDTPCLVFHVRASARNSSGAVIVSNKLRIALKCRHRAQSIAFLHLDADGSVTNGAIIEPQDMSRCPCPVVVALCGVGATAKSQADSHKWQQKGDQHFTFGFLSAWVLAPYRQGAHNGEGTGFWTPLSALAYLGRHASADIMRVIYTGHSRGGHWAYTLAEHRPAPALALMSAGGYGDREDYGDANIMFDLDVQMAFMSPMVRAVLESTLAEHDNHASASNLQGLNVLVRCGGQDQTVQPYFQRRMARVLHHHGVNVTFDEVKGQGHWWWDTLSASDGGVMHDASVRRFMEHHLSLLHPPPPPLPFFTVTCWNPATYFASHGITILQMFSRLTKAVVHVHRRRGHSATGNRVTEVWQLEPHNVKRLRVELQHEACSWCKSSQHSFQELTIVLPGLTHHLQADSDGCFPALEVCSMQQAGQAVWQTCPARATAIERLPITYGPARQVWARPFLIVVGTAGSAEQNELLLSLGRYLSLAHDHASYSSAQLVLDSQLSLEAWQTWPVSLILIGGPSANLWSKHAAQESAFPVAFGPDDRTIRVGGCNFTSAAIAFTFSMQAGATQHLSFIITATAEDFQQNRSAFDSLLTALVMHSFSSNVPLTRAPFSNMFPDWMVAGPAYRSEGYGGILGTGFWNNEWKHDALNGYLDPACSSMGGPNPTGPVPAKPAGPPREGVTDAKPDRPHQEL